MIPVLIHDHILWLVVCLLLYSALEVVAGVELPDGFSWASTNDPDVVSMDDSGSGGLAPFSASQVWMYLGERVIFRGCSIVKCVCGYLRALRVL